MDMDIETDLRLASLFMYELENQCDLALQAFKLLRMETEKLSEPIIFPTDNDEMEQQWLARRWATRRQFMHAHALLSHVANVSKILWPSPLSKKLAAQHPISNVDRNMRGEALCRILCLESTSPLNERNHRNDLEHFDERLESWWVTDAGQILALRDMNSMPFGWNPRFSGRMSEATLRGLRADPFAFTFLDREVQLAPIAEALLELRDNVLEWQIEAGKMGLRLGTSFSESYSPTPIGGRVPDNMIPSRAQLAEAFHALGIGDDGDLLHRISAFIADRSGYWKVEPRPQDGTVAVTVTFPIEQYNYVAHDASIEIALGSATLYLLKQIETELQRPAILRVAQNGEWSVH